MPLTRVEPENDEPDCDEGRVVMDTRSRADSHRNQAQGEEAGERAQGDESPPHNFSAPSGHAPSSQASPGVGRGAHPAPHPVASLVRSLVAVLVGSLVLRLAAQTTGQMLQFYFKEINESHYYLSYTATGFITASFFIAELLGAPVLGAMSDRYGRKPFIILGPLLGAIAVQITSMTVVVSLLVLTRLLEGLSTASSVPATLGYISETTVGRPNLRARVIGLYEITLVGGLALGATVGGYLWEWLGKVKPMTFAGLQLVSPAFCVNGMIYVVSLVIFVWGLKNIRRGSHQTPVTARGKLNHYREVFKSPAVWMFIPAWLSVFSIVGMWTNHSPRLMTSEQNYGNQLLTGINTVKFGNSFAALAVVFGMGILGWSFILGRYRKTSVMLVATGGLFVTLAAVYGFNHVESFSSALYYPLLASLLFGIIVLSGFTPAALTYLADVTESYSEDRGSIMGLYSVFLGVGQLLGTATGGYFADWDGTDGLLLLSAFFGLVTTLSLVLLRERTSPAPPLPQAPAQGK
ncbi:MAG TPA: MFS transporter [Blastocatellia bacterium]|jgi:MFS family permease|nr:MFS transporter [Blastocatellia bacterium]